MISSRRLARVFCLPAAVGLLVPFVMWSSTDTDSLDSIPNKRVATSRFTLGLPSTPWFEYATRDERTDLPGGGWNQERTGCGQIVWLSWSWLLLAGVVGCVTAFRSLHERTTEADREYRAEAAAPHADVRDPR